MTITAAIVLFAVTWFIVFFCMLPVQFKSQLEAGVIEPGTPSSAPADHRIGFKARVTTAITVVVFAALYLVITSGLITIDNMDIFHVLH